VKAGSYLMVMPTPGKTETSNSFPDLLFRRFEEGDVEGIRRIYPAFFEDCPQLKAEEGFIVAEMNGQIVGFFVVTTHMTYPWWDREWSPGVR